MEALSQPTLTLRFPTGPFDFDELTLHQMAVVGRICTRMSAYEYSCDSFIFAVAERYPAFIKEHRLSPAFNNDEKRRAFILTTLERLAPLKDMADADGKIDLSAVGLMMEQLWHHRVNLTHGRLTGSQRDDHSIELDFVKWSKSGDEKNTYHHSSFSYDQPLLELVLDRASYLQAMLTEATQLVMGEH